jgi:Glucose-6-phosphate 1-dehydrogenase
LFIDNWRWADVPVYMRVGKRLPKSATEISIHFKKAPAVLFNKDLRDLNVLVIRIQPDEGISLRIHAKVPGTSFRIEPVKMDFHYGTSFGKPARKRTNVLLLDAMSGDATLFARSDEVEASLGFHRSNRGSLARKERCPELYFYPAGSWGPEAADDLLARDGRAWRRL